MSRQFSYKTTGRAGVHFNVYPHTALTSGDALPCPALPDALMICAPVTDAVLEKYMSVCKQRRRTIPYIVVVGDGVGGVNASGGNLLSAFLDHMRQLGSKVTLLPPSFSRRYRLPATIEGELGRVLLQSWTWEFFSTIGGTPRPDGKGWAASRAFCLRINAAGVATAAEALGSTGHSLTQAEWLAAKADASAHQDFSEAQGHFGTDGPQLAREVEDAAMELDRARRHMTAALGGFVRDRIVLAASRSAKELNILLVTFKHAVLRYLCQGTSPYQDISQHGSGLSPETKTHACLDPRVVNPVALAKLRETVARFRGTLLLTPPYDPLAAAAVEDHLYGTSMLACKEATQAWLHEFTVSACAPKPVEHPLQEAVRSDIRPRTVHLHTDPGEEADDRVLARGILRHWKEDITVHAFLAGGDMTPQERLCHYVRVFD